MPPGLAFQIEIKNFLSIQIRGEKQIEINPKMCKISKKQTEKLEN